MENKVKKAMTLDEFKTFAQPEMWNSIKGGGKTFMDCHHEIFSKTGIWIEELVPIFQKLDSKIDIITK